MCRSLASRLLLTFCLLPSALTFAQTASTYTPTLTFGAASIKEGKIENNGIIVRADNPPHAGTLRLQNNSPLNLILMAYDVDYNYITGIPDVLARKFYNVDATSDPETNDKLAKLSNDDAKLEKRHMIQALLADRFKLKVHFETTQVAVFNMVVAKNGPKFQPAQPKPIDPADVNNPAKTTPPVLYQRGSSMSFFEFHCEGCGMTQFARSMGGQFGKKVIDKTGLTGTYGFVVKYHGRFDEDNPEPADPSAPPLDTALQDQLGLKVEPGKGEVQALVVDHMELPSEN